MQRLGVQLFAWPADASRTGLTPPYAEPGMRPRQKGNTGLMSAVAGTGLRQERCLLFHKIVGDHDDIANGVERRIDPKRLTMLAFPTDSKSMKHSRLSNPPIASRTGLTPPQGGIRTENPTVKE